MSLAIAHSRCIYGTEAVAIRVETHLANGLPTFTIVGLPETAVRESRDRVRSAIVNSGYEFPQRRITVNLAPGDIPKEGTRFDLAIAVGILAASGQVASAQLDDTEFVAELALDGSLRSARTMFATALGSCDSGHRLVVCQADAVDAGLVRGARVHSAADLGSVCADLDGHAALPRQDNTPVSADSPVADLADVAGQLSARRAIEVAAAGGHNLLLLGPPGTGKSMLARRLPGILPPLSVSAAMESAAIRSIAGERIEPGNWLQRPYRAPHHAASAAALVGGGRIPRPGEISRAHHGVLFLDELPEFDRRALEALREPLQNGSITVARARDTVQFPARFQLIAAMNPCPCGYAGDPQFECRCTAERIARYRARVSGPLANRIDLHVEVPRQNLILFTPDDSPGESSAAVRARVVAAYTAQEERQGIANAHLSDSALRRVCKLDAACLELLERANASLALSARSLNKIVAVARTIADLDNTRAIESAHLAEAIAYRRLDRRDTGV